MSAPGPVSCPRLAVRADSRFRHIRRAAAVILAVVVGATLPARCVHAQVESPSSDLFTPVSDGPGIQFRTGHIAFPTFGRNTSITHAELFPYLLDDNQMFFGDFRMFLTNYGQLGGNVGLGYRTRPWGGTNIFGASLWYDADDSLGDLYQDVGISLEHYGELFDLRLNGYVPVGTTEQELADRLVNPRFVGNGMVYDRVLVYGTALGGVDYEVGVPLPSTVLRQHNLRFYAGAYHFGGNGVDLINGGKLRLEGSIIPSVEAQVAVTSDSYFGTNVTLGVSWTYFGGFERTETNQALRYDRMGEFVNRNYNVIVGKRKDVTVGVTAINPNTNLPYVIQHVGPGGNSSGTPDDPWGTIAAAQAAGGDVIIVHAGTIITEAIVLQDGEVIIGQGNGMQDYLNVAGYGAVAVPKVGTSTNAPVIQGVSGNAVTLANDSVFAGFIIDSPSGHGIFANGVHDAVVSNVQINGAGGDGLFVQNGTGDFLFHDVVVKNAAGAGLHVLGGAADIRYTGRIETNVGHSVLIADTADGLVDLTDAIIKDEGGDGVRLLNNDGDVILDNVTVTDASGIGVEIRGGEGAVTLLNDTKITDAAGAALVIAEREGNTLVNHADIEGADGQRGIEVTLNDAETWFNRVDVETTDATGIYTRDSDRVSIVAGIVDSDGGPALDFEDTVINMLLNKVSSKGGPFGIRISGGDGTFAIGGTAALGSAGTIEDADVGILLENFDTAGLASIDLKNNGVGLQADNVEKLALTNMRVTGSDSHALELLNVDEFHSVNSRYEDNGSLDATIVYEVSEAGNRVFNLSTNTIETDFGDAIRIEGLGGAAGSTLNVSMQGNAIKTHADFATGLSLDWNGVLLANMITNGIQTTGDDSTAYSIATHGAGLSQISIGSNVLFLDGDSNTGVQVTTSGPTELILGGNQIAFNGTGTTGFDFTLAESADVSILSNTLIDVGGGGTGMFFQSLNGPSTIEIEQNTLDFRGPGALIDRGIIFQSITDVVTLKGTKSNSVINATTPFFAPAGTTSGRININGQMLPQ